MKQPIYLLQALICGTVISFIDSRTDEVQVAALLMIVTTFIFGAMQARQAWVYALIIGLSIFAFHAVSHIVGWFTGIDGAPGNPVFSLIALIPAFIGAYCGAGLHWVLDGFNENQKSEV